MKTIFWHPCREQGAVAIIVALSLAVLIGFVGLALDLGKMFVTKTELQNAADACALAAARDLTSSTVDITILTRAEQAGMKVGSQNKDSFQSMQVVFTSDSSVTFSDSLNGTYATKGGASPNSKYARCTVERPNIKMWFMQVLNVLPGVTITDQVVSSTAVASLSPSQSNCAVPMGMCGTGTGGNFGLEIGKWYSTKFEPGSGPGENPTGNFNWIDFNPGAPTPPCAGGGAQELACIMQGPGQCNLPPVGPATCPNGTSGVPEGCVGQTGAQASLAKAYNTRFGLYSGGSGISETDLKNAPPDHTGYSYDTSTWLPGKEAFSNFKTAREANLAYQSSFAGYQSATGGGTGQLAQFGTDRRLVTVPIVSCPAYTPGQNVPILGYACVLLLNPFKSPHDEVLVEYLGRSNATGNPCATSGAVGSTGSNGPLVPSLVQ